MSSDARPTKRAREQSDDAPLARSPEYWFEDGNIVLQVESTQFRVTKGVLARHSSLFKDMLSLPLPQDEPLVDECPLVVLSGDSSADWTHLLAAMYPDSCFDSKPAAGYAAVAAVLRLSKKYDMANFRQATVRRLKTDFPTTLAAYHAQRSAQPSIAQVSPGGEDVDLSYVIAVAREVDLYSILPSALYSYVVKKIAYDGEPWSKLNLAPVDEAMLFKGYARLARLHSLTPERTSVGAVPSPTCRRSCDEAAFEYLDELKDSLASVDVFAQWHAWSDHLCSLCVQHSESIYEIAQGNLWHALPSFFGLPSWDELKGMDFE
ncbi:BTB domain-containing protein [Mycena kentingensis (nom. inval.)]|nr:BTB domain-containing protein [Mycena kentingensis (nom. inval.)]